MFSAFTQCVLPDQGGIIFLASLKTGTTLVPALGGVVSSNNQGIWAEDTNGILKQILRKGDALTVNGATKIVSSISIFSAPTGFSGQTRHFNDRGDLGYKVTFTDGSNSFVQSVFP